MITNYHAKYYSYELTAKHSSTSVDRLSRSLFDASVDLNPHQIEASLFALRSPLSKGVVLADEVGLGKTIEAALVLCQLWAEKKRNLLIVCPASLRKQWATELQEKFNLPTQVLDKVTYNRMQRNGIYTPLQSGKITIVSYHFPLSLEAEFLAIPWDLVVIDEAHKLRNAHRQSNKIGQTIKRIFDGRQKLLLTATPLQNSLIEIYGLSTLIDDHLFGDDKSFRKQFMSGDSSMPDLRDRLSQFVKRTLRKNVLEYIRYTERKAVTVPFMPTDKEQDLYESISAFLANENTYALPKRQRHLTSLIIRKLLASSSHAIVNTMETIKQRLERLRDDQPQNDEEFLDHLIEDDDLETDYLEEDLDDADSLPESAVANVKQKIEEEIELVEGLISKARSISNDTKATALLKALEIGFQRMANMVDTKTGQHAPRKAIIFTESRRTQEYLAAFLQANGYQGKIVSFSGTNTGEQASEIYKGWLAENQGSDRVSGSAQVDKRTALIDYFKNHAEILIATEAAAEGVNLQFCALLINYDLPWNPQRIEQRIGRCHRYGQKFDVVVINFLNERNQADQRVLQLLSDKFNLFNGVFGASDEVLGRIENGIDFEKRISEIYDTCRSPEAIEVAFTNLQKELEEHINQKIKATQQILIENFDEDIHDLLKIKLDQAEERLDKVGRWFWRLTKHILESQAAFEDEKYAFNLEQPVIPSAPAGKYQLVRKQGAATIEHAHTYRLTHPLGEYVLQKGADIDTPNAEIVFGYSGHPTKISAVEQIKGKAGWLNLRLVRVEALQTEEYLVFTAQTDDGQNLDKETCEKLFGCESSAAPRPISDNAPGSLLANAKRHVDAQISEIVEANNRFFQEERDKLEKWADDKIFAAEQALSDTKNRLRSLKRESRLAASIEDQQRIQTEIRELETLQRRQRQEIFEVEDEIIAKRDELIAALEQKLKQKTDIQELFTIRWKVA
ncbi:MAG: DEAD/DEAH box helicase family protein [Proteobacteria bacterium]|nr:DEAD/DEAH box helicase family protein [Pseudomonadota bacterium]